MPISVHAQCVNEHQTNETGERADDALRTIGRMQSSCIIPERQQIPWHQAQGGVVGHGHGSELIPMMVSPSRRDASVSVSLSRENHLLVLSE